MDTALRNRLTGAVILVLLAVLLLPELLTGSGRDPTPVPLPAVGDGPPRQRYTIDLTDASSAPVGLATSAPAPTPSPTPGSDDAPVELPVLPPTAAPAAVAPVTAAPVAAPPVAAPPAAVAPVAAPPVAAPPVAAPPVAVSATPAGRNFFVQVGTFATRERAEVLRSDLARRGFEVTINEAAGGAKSFHRVRVGPVADRKAAEALEVRLRSLAPDRAIVAVP